MGAPGVVCTQKRGASRRHRRQQAGPMGACTSHPSVDEAPSPKSSASSPSSLKSSASFADGPEVELHVDAARGAPGGVMISHAQETEESRQGPRHQTGDWWRARAAVKVEDEVRLARADSIIVGPPLAGPCAPHPEPQEHDAPLQKAPTTPRDPTVLSMCKPTHSRAPSCVGAGVF